MESIFETPVKSLLLRENNDIKDDFNHQSLAKKSHIINIQERTRENVNRSKAFKIERVDLLVFFSELLRATFQIMLDLWKSS